MVTCTVNVTTHVAISKAVSRYLHLDPSLEECFIRGLKRSDLNAGRRGRRIRRHHGVHLERIMNIIWRITRCKQGF